MPTARLDSQIEGLPHFVWRWDMVWVKRSQRKHYDRRSIDRLALVDGFRYRTLADCGWLVTAAIADEEICPDCGGRSQRPHGWRNRHLQDLPVPGEAVTLRLRLSRWCRTLHECQRKTFADHLPDIALTFARRTKRISEIATLLWHSTGGRPDERLMRWLGMPISDDRIRRQLKRDAMVHRSTA
jgi:hypothetical protein